MPSNVNKRRAMREKKARRKHLMVAFAFFIIIALITLAIMCFTVFFPIKKINVSGSEIYTKSQIIKASKLSTEDNLFVVSENEIENNIRKKLPYIDDVQLKRRLPDAVILTVTDAKEYAYFQSDENFYILSENGYVLKKQETIPENVFEIICGGIKGKVGEKATYENSTEEELVGLLIKNLSKANLNIDKIDVSKSLEITVEVEGRFTVLFGSSEYIAEKSAHLASMIESINDRSGKINLSMWTPQNSQGTFVEKNT